MKKAFITLFLVITCGYISAQKNYEKSPAFDEIDGWSKLIILRNGNTGLIDITNKEGANFRLYDPQRKKIKSGKLNLAKIGDKLKYAQIEGVYDINGDFVMFVLAASEENKKKPLFFRVVVNGNSGDLKSEEMIGELEEIHMGTAMAVAYGDLDVPSFFVEKDPDSDYYMVIKYNTTATESNERIIITHYGPDHKAINTAKYNSPTDKYKYIKYIGGYVHGADYIFIGTHAFNTKKSGGDEARFYVAQLGKGKTNFTQKELGFTEFTKHASGCFIYNKTKDLVNMHLVVNSKGINQNINPTTLQLEKPYAADFTKANDIFKNKMNRKNDFGGVLQGTFADKNGNITYLYQELTSKIQSGQYGMPSTVVGQFFGDVVLITMSPEGKEVSSGAFPCNIYRKGDHNYFCYNHALKGRKVNGGMSPVFDNDWYYLINMVSTENGSYLFFNNTIDNMEKPETKEAGRIAGISGTAGVKYTYKGGTITREFMFGTPESKKEAKFINPGASDYNVASKTYATILTDPKEKKSTVVWMKLD